MSERFAELHRRWSALPPRTRTLAAIGIVLTAAGLLYTVVWAPLQKDLTRLRVSVPRAAGQIEWMRTQAPLAKAMRARAVTSTSALTPALEQSAASHNVRTYVTKIESEGNNSARVTLEAIPFNALINWIAELQAAQGAVIDDANVDAHAMPGLVNARLRLRTGGT